MAAADGKGSSPDLLVQLVRDMREETRDGIERLDKRFDALDGDIKQHARDDNAGFAAVRGEIGQVRQEHSATAQTVAKIVGERNAEATFGPNGTGRHTVVPDKSANEIVIPTPPMGVPVEVRIGARHSRSIPPIMSWIAKAASSSVGTSIGKAAGAAALIGVGALAHHVAQPLGETKVVTVEVPAPSPPAAIATAPVVT